MLRRAREGGTAGRASKGLEALGLAMLAIADQGMDVRIGDPEVRAVLVGTSEPFRVDADGGLPVGFSPQARDAPAPALALHPTEQRSRWSVRRFAPPREEEGRR